VTGCDLLVLDDVAALLDEDSRAAVRSTLERSTSLAVVEASASEPLLRTATILEVQVRS
jgi:recombinational DNA repair ATPase RecF